MKRISDASGDRLPFLITAAVFVLMLICIPLVLRVDDGVDTNRPMYMDMAKMQGMQQAYITTTGQPPIETKLTDGKSLTIGDNEFTPSAGVTMGVRAIKDDDYCITASNDAGAKSQRCVDSATGEVLD